MIGIRLTEAKGRFLDTRKITSRVDRAALRMLGKVGGRTRLRQKQSIRRRKRTSNPGEPPSSHGGELRKFIFYFVDRTAKRMVSGPILLDGRGQGDAPEMLEHGGDAMRRRYDAKRRTYGPAKPVHYEARPSARPAAEAEFPKAAGYLKGEVR